ncbi:MAG: hypothetical protein LBK62_04000 [Treponema sp.]|jgi:hypothetical protein|nr:hypothetical protein [Treponema sp.]
MVFTATPVQKVILSLLISLVLFAAVSALAFTGVFDLVETRFYNPSIIKSLTRETAGDAEVMQDLLSDLQKRFAASLNASSVRRSFLPNQSGGDILERSGIYERLLEATAGLQSVRFVDSAGAEIHFSTYPPDIISQDQFSVTYRSYNDDPHNLPLETLRVSAGEHTKLTVDNVQDRIIFSFPFFDLTDAYQGTALFTVSAKVLAERLIGAGRIRAGENITLINTPPGIISGSPETAKTGIIAGICSVWSDGLLGLIPLDSAGSGISLALVSAKTDQGVFYGRLINEAAFSFPASMKTLLLLSVFLTLFLTVFFCFNLKLDPVAVILYRLKDLRNSLMEQFYEQESEMDWTRWTMELEQRREGVRAELKRGIKWGRDRYTETDVDSLIDKSWDELVALIGIRGKPGTGIDEEKLRSILDRVIRTLPAALSSTEARSSDAAAPHLLRRDDSSEPAKADGASPVEDFAELGDIEFLTFEETGENAGSGGEMDKPEPDHSASGRSGKGSLPEPPPFQAGGLLAAAMQKRAVISSAVSGTNPPATPKNSKLKRLQVPATENMLIKEVKKMEEPEELEELEEDEEIGELEELERENPKTEAPPSQGPQPLSNNIKELESEIEFSDTTTEESGAEETIPAELEIVSPFSSMFSPRKTETILQEQDGVPHINGGVLSPDKKTEAGLDQDFKNLVETVVKR